MLVLRGSRILREKRLRQMGQLIQQLQLSLTSPIGRDCRMQVPLSQTEIHQEQLGQIGLVRLNKEELGQIELELRTQEPLGRHALDRQTQMARGQNGLHC